MKKKNGFTLIELLAVIIILGILMIIAIPSVTKYISDSRKSAYVDTAKEIVAGTRNTVNEGKLGMYSTDTTYYIPFDYIKSENGTKSPYGEFVYAYVGVIYDGKGYTYYWISVDDAGQGVDEVTPAAILNEDDIKSDINALDIKQKVDSTGIGGRKKVLVLENGSWVTKTENAQNNVPEEGGSGSGGANVPTAAQTISQIEGLVDVAEAKRYTGANPNNYVKFNGNEIWRIIGVYGDNLKIIRNTQLPSTMKYNNSIISNYVEWSTSTLSNYLNNDYYNSLQNSTQNMIENGKWYVNKSDYYYNASRAYNDIKGQEWYGKVGVLAPYELLYSANQSCWGTSADGLAQPCLDSIWLKMSSQYYLINGYKLGWDCVLYVNDYAGIRHTNNNYPDLPIYPVVYLKSSVKITGGTGTSGDPYILG